MPHGCARRPPHPRGGGPTDCRARAAKKPGTGARARALSRDWQLRPLYVFDDVVSEASVRRAVTWIRSQREAGAQALVIKIDSPGGEVDAGLRLVNTLGSVGIPTYCVVTIAPTRWASRSCRRAPCAWPPCARP